MRHLYEVIIIQKWWFFRFHADSSPGLITNKNNQTENEVYPSEEQDTIGAKYFLNTGKEQPFCRKFTVIIPLKYIFLLKK